MALKGINVIEFLGLAPGPLCGTILADFGANVTVISKLEPFPLDVLSNGKKNIAINMKTKEGVDIIKKLCKSTDVLLDTFRPGVMEKLGLGPDTLQTQNPQLIYARLTGYGQTGLYKNCAGHDINYVAMSGVLSTFVKNNEPPFPPLNLLGDFAAGSVLCSLGILLALFERSKSGKGQIVDSSMTEGLAYLSSWLFKSRNSPIWQGNPGTNLLDGGYPGYGTYKTKDDKFMAVGALEPQFYKIFLSGLELSEEEYGQFSDPDDCKRKFTEVFLKKTQDEWCSIFDDLDACVTPVLDIDSIDEHKYYKVKRSIYRDINNVLVPEPFPYLNRTPGLSVGRKPKAVLGQHTIEVLQNLGYKKLDIDELIAKGCVHASKKCNL